MTIAIVVTYNPEVELLESQYDKLRGQVDGIVYVDNGSAAGFELPKEKDVRIIRNKENRGLGVAQNQGIKAALELGADHILLMDQDSEPADSMVAELLSTERALLASSVKVGAVGPKAVSAFDPNKKSYGVTSLGFSCKMEAIEDTPLEVAYCIASGTLIRADVLKEVGLIDERLFIDALDLEWCVRAVSKGYRIFLSGKALLMHRLGNGETDKVLSHSARREYYICRNNLLLMRYHHIPVSYKSRKAIMTPLRVFKSLVHRNMNHFKMGMKGMVHGIVGKF